MDLEKAMRFILEQQAALTASLQQSQAETAQLRAAVERHSQDLEVHTEWKIEMSRALQDLAAQMKDGFLQMAHLHNELAAAQLETRRDLNLLIGTVQQILPRLPKQ